MGLLKRIGAPAMIASALEKLFARRHLLLKRIGPLAMIAAASLCGAASMSAAPGEYQVKAVFLFNFSQFVDWPAPAFSDAQSPLIIGVLGEDPFGSALDEVVRGETVNGRPLAVRRYRHIGEVDTCHILFIDDSQQARLAEILGALHGRSILTVGDFDGFARRGGVIRFGTVDNRIRMYINLEAAKTAGLTISSKLLRPAQIVEPGAAD